MNLQISLSSRVAAWLKKHARSTGTDEAEVAARLLEQLAVHERGGNGSSVDQRVGAFDQWVSTLAPRPGPPVDSSRDRIYE